MQRLITDAVKLSHESALLCEKWRKEKKLSPIVNQFYRSSNSISANMLEATAAESETDKIHKLSIALKESRETSGWINTLRTIAYLDDDKHLQLIKLNSRVGAGLYFIIKSMKK